mmetsp:Transcript_32714/g.60086  ORF Transcript_32714/g.60086 Transcript_32714/m.60086 type:complete len:666 (+) Transcript_32714:87-2084(+)
MICLICLTFASLACSIDGLKISRDSIINISRRVGEQVQRKIPKIIHQTWKNHKLPSEFQKWSRSWQECLPDWEYKLHTDEDNRKFIEEHFPEFLQTYDNYDPPIKRVDAARYAYLAIEGGLYADLDMECMRDPTQLTDLSINSEAVDLTLACEKFSQGGQISNAIMLSSSDEGRAFFKKLMQRLPYSSSLETCYATGPQFLTRSFVDYLMDGVSIDNPEERERLVDFRPEFGTVKSLRKGAAHIAVADDALLFNIPWFALDTKEYCMDREWCKRRFPYAMSVSHWSSSWLPEINTLSTGDFIRAYDFENKKCAAEGGDRLFKLDKSHEEDVDLEHCGQTCKANPACRFFSMFPDQWCIGCKGQPSEAHEGFWTYQMKNDDASTAELLDEPTMVTDSSSSPLQVNLPRLPSLDNDRMFGLDNMECSRKGDERVFEVNGFPEQVDQVDYCSDRCKTRPDCKFFTIVQGHLCIGCKVEPTSPLDSAWTYKMTAEDRDPFLATSFTRMFALDNKKCSAERGDRLFKLDQLSADTDQIYACNKACEESPECKFFGVHLYSQWCIGCKEQPAEESIGFWTYKMTLPEKDASKLREESIADGTGVVAPLIQSSESRNVDSSQICSCLVKGLTGAAPVKCNKLLKQQMDRLHEVGASRRETFRRLLDSHLHRC